MEVFNSIVKIILLIGAIIDIVQNKFDSAFIKIILVNVMK